jgi:glycosyltransferase involved in cell wall biosynthesis
LKFSIIINCYNTLPIIKKCIGSVIESTDSDTEILLVNNHPPYQNVQTYLKGSIHPRVKILDPGKNLSHILGTQFAEKFAGGDYLVRMDDDAVLHKNNWIKAMSQALNQFSDLAYVGLPWPGISLTGVNRISTPEFTLEYADMVLFTCVMFQRSIWRSYFIIPQQGIYGNDDSYSAQKANQLGLKKAYLISHPCEHLGRTSECDPLYGAWKVFYAMNSTNADFGTWRNSISQINSQEENLLRQFGYPQDQIEQIKMIFSQPCKK